MKAAQANLALEENPGESGKSRLGIGSVVSRDEMNLAEFPLTVLSTRVNTAVKTLEFKDSIRMKNGDLIEREWVITGADKFGLPTSTDDDVILGLMCLTMDQGFRERKIFFSRYELLKILRWSTEGRSYTRLSKSLDRLSGVRIRATNAFFDNSNKGFQTCNFGIIDAYEICDTRGSGDKSYFIWSEMLFDSFQSGFIKKIDLDFYFSLKSSVSRRLYRYLDKHFYHRSIVEKPLLTLAFEKLGLSRSYQYVSSIKQQLEPAAEELMELGFIEGFSFHGSGATTVARFIQNPHFSAQKKRQSQQISSVSSIGIDSQPGTKQKKSQLEDKLQKHGLTVLQTKRLLDKKNEAELEVVADTVKRFEASKGSFANPVGFLYRAVQDAERFPMPASKQSVPIKRPVENPAARQKIEKLRAAYEQYLTEIADNELKKLDASEKAELRNQLRIKLKPLENVLDAKRFEEALNGCIREEVRKKIIVLSYDKWLANLLAA